MQDLDGFLWFRFMSWGVNCLGKGNLFNFAKNLNCYA